MYHFMSIKFKDGKTATYRKFITVNFDLNSNILTLCGRLGEIERVMDVDDNTEIVEVLDDLRFIDINLNDIDSIWA